MHGYEQLWERSMIDRGIERYLNECQRAKVRVTKEGKRIPAKDESTTSYGLSIMRDIFGPFEEVINWTLGQQKTGAPSLAMAYIAACDTREVAYLSAKCIIDSISRREKHPALAMRIASHIEDHMRFASFDETHPKYYKAVMNSLKTSHTSDYRSKRKALVHAHNIAADPVAVEQRARTQAHRLDMSAADTEALVAERVAGCDGAEWTPWTPRDKANIGVALIEMFILATSDYENGESAVNNCCDTDKRIPYSGFVEKVKSKDGKKSVVHVVGTEYAAEYIRANMEVFATLHPEYMPTLMPPKPWTTPYDGGYWLPQLRERKPLVKAKRAHLKILEDTYMPTVYQAVNAAQGTAWQVNSFVFEEAMNQWRAPHGVKMPGQAPIEIPPNPLGDLDQGEMTDAEFRKYKKHVRTTLTPDEKKDYLIWCMMKRDLIVKEQERVSKVCNLESALRVARKLSQESEFYYVYSLDYRGRLYPCGTGLNPQGSPLSKALLQFRDGTKLGKDGFWHMCLHAAGVYGVDKVSLEDRVQWVLDNKQAIIRTGLNPAETQDFWAAADKPYMFLAVCKELSDVLMFNKLAVNNCLQESFEFFGSEYESHLPGNQDGSCNGIQHFSAMLLDTVGARAVNMTAQALGCTPSDIYQEACDEARKAIEADLSGGLVLNGKRRKPVDFELRRLLEMVLPVMNRKTTKRSTMIVPYGGTKRSCLKHVKQWVMDTAEETGLFTDKEVYLLALPLHHYVWHALDVVVVAARVAMAFLRDVIKPMCAHNMPVMWPTPTGFVGMQDIKATKNKEVDVRMFGRIRVSYNEPTDDLNKAKMSTSWAPNFVHSMDAAHCMMSVSAAQDLGIKDFMLVHDSFGVPFGQCEAFHKIIRQQFVDIYSNNVLLALKRNLMAQLPTVPENKFPADDRVKGGDYEIEDVKKAIHFFR